MQSVTIYTDGSSLGNPGPGGYGAVLTYIDEKNTQHQLELSEGFSKTTNNRMEMLAVIVALEALKRPCNVTVMSDSQYVVNAHQNHWISGWQKRGWKTASKQPVKNRDLWERMVAAEAPHTVSFNWVKGHAGNPLNERCDQLAVAAASGSDLPPDPGFEAEAR